MKTVRLFVLSLVFCASFGSTAAQSDKVLMTVGDEEVSQEEFMHIFYKNFRKDTVTKADLDEYVDLFVKFKLKVVEAEARGMHEEEKFKNELAGYRRTVAQPYLVDREMTEELIQEAYDRMTKEVKASHIMVKVNENASPEDTLKAYNKALALRKRVMGGEDFAEVAMSKNGSEDPSARDNGGDLGYFSVFRMVYPFESAVYNMEVGEVSMPVRTKYGYHIIKKTGERPARGEIRAAHILVSVDKKASEQQKKRAKEKIDEIYELATSGEDFGQLARKHSDDRGSAQKGGVLPWFGAGRMVDEFEDAAFSLEEDGQISKPFRTSYGWHIVKRLDYRPIKDLEEVRGQIKAKIKRDSRSKKSKVSFYTKLKKEYSYKDYYSKRKKKILASLDSSIFVGEWDTTSLWKPSKKLMSFGDQEYTIADFGRFLQRKQRKQRPENLDSYLDHKFKSWVALELYQYEKGRLDEKYPEFRRLMKEYRDGILLFELNDEMVWSKAVKDSAGLEEFYENHKSEFMWKQRADAKIYKCANEEIADQVIAMIEADSSSTAIMNSINEGSQLNISLEKGLMETEEHPVLSKVEVLEPGVQKLDGSDGQVYVIRILDIRPPEAKKLEEARGIITAKYQEHLEEEWVKELKAKYPVKINEDVLYEITTLPRPE